MKQNTQLWVVPQGNLNSVQIKPNQTQSLSFIQDKDGIFGYEIWGTFDSVGQVNFSLDLNGKELYSTITIADIKKGKWLEIGKLSVAKGEHRIDIKNLGEDTLNVTRGLLTRDRPYIRNGYADIDAELIIKGEDISENLDSKYDINYRETPEEKSVRLKKLAETGFLERENQYVATGICRCGVPMGGIGAGKVELDDEGYFTAITINNNQDVPIYRTDGSFFAAFYKQDGDNSKSVLLQKKGGYLPEYMKRIEEIDYQGLFPKAILNYSSLPFSLKLEAFSSLIPNDIKNSSLPSITYKFTATNTSDKDIEASLMFSWENLLGTGGSMVIRSGDSTHLTPHIMNTWNEGYTWCNHIGNAQEKWQSEKYSGINYKSKESHGNPSSFGEYTILTENDDTEVSFCESWNSKTDTEKFWNDFSANGKFNETYDNEPAQNCTEHSCAAISKNFMLKKSETKEIVFVFSWYLPEYLDATKKDIGVYYDNFFSNSKEIAEYTLTNYKDFHDKTLCFTDMMMASSLPKWLSEKIINDRFPIYTNSWYTKDGKFSINEAPTGMMGCLGTMDQKLACNSLYTNFFTELDYTELKIFADQQAENGSIPHDIGNGIFNEGPYDGTWSDLCSSFILQIYKHYIYTNNKNFLDEMYPKIKKAVDFQLSIDFDENNIPDVGPGNGTTYDTYHWYGTSAFVAILWLAELKASIKLAEAMGDKDFAYKCEDLFVKSQKAVVDELWKEFPYGGHFINYYDKVSGKSSDNCFIAQLAGQWFADLMYLGDLLPPKMIDESLKTIWSRNIEFDNFKLMNDETTSDGKIFSYGYTFVQYNQAYFACLAITRGMVENGLSCVERIWEASNESPWNIGLTYFTDGSFSGLPYYMTNPVSLFLIDALSGWLPNACDKSIRFKIADEKNALTLPLFSPKIWVKLTYNPIINGANYSINITKNVEDNTFNSIIIDSKKIVSVKYNGEGLSDFTNQNGKLTFKKCFKENDTIEIVTE